MSSLYTSDPSVQPVRIAGVKHHRASVIPLVVRPSVLPESIEPCYSDFIGGPATASTRRLQGARVAS